MADYRVFRRANWLMTNVPGASLLRTGPRTVEWTVKTYLRSRRQRTDGHPTPMATPRLAAQVAIDEAVLALMMRPSKFPTPEDYLRVGAELADTAALYRDRGWLGDPIAFHGPDPEPAHPTTSKRRWLRQPYRHLRFESGWEPPADHPGAERWHSYRTDEAHVAVLRHRGEDRPWLLCLHGFGMGFVAGDFAAFRAEHLHHDLGLNIAMPVMPLHGPRRSEGAPELLSYDLVNTVLGVSQAIHDTRRLIGWLRSETDQPIGAYGVSLGGYTTALVSGLVDLDLAIAGIPVVDFPGLFRHHAPHRVERQATDGGLLGPNANDAHSVISPLLLEPRVPADRRHVYAGLGDRMVPPPQPRRLAEHWGVDACWYPGNHVGFMWSNKAKSFIDAALTGANMARRPADADDAAA